MNTRRFLLAAAFAAMAFTFLACSSDEPSGDGNSSSSGATQGGGNPSSSSNGGISNLPKEVYLVENFNGDNKKKYDDDGDIFVRLDNYRSRSCESAPVGGQYCECTDYDGVVSECKDEDLYDTLPVGKIQNGQVSLNLPSSIDNKYLDKEEFGNNEYCTFSGTPKTVFAESFSLYVIIPEKNCRIRSYLIKSGKTSQATLFYLSESGSLDGTQTCIYSDGSGGGTEQTTNYDMNFSRGWNLVLIDGDYWTTDLSKGGTLEWWLRCDNH